MDRLADAFRAELTAFTEVVAGRPTSPCTVDDALAVTWIAEAATLSLQQHRPVQIDEVQTVTATPATSRSPDATDRARPGSPAHPISWGVCEVPNWGYQLAPSRVLAEMRDVGLAATELGPDGFLPADPDQMAGVLAAHHLTAVGGFTPVLMHRPGHDPLPEIDRILEQYDATARRGPRALRDVRARRLRQPARPSTTTAGTLLLGNLDRISDRGRRTRRARRAAPPRRAPWSRTATRCSGCSSGSSISLCLDTGHLLIGGTDPAELTRQAPDRIAHTHLKDVDSQIADKVRAGRLTYTEAVVEGMYRPLGTGDVDVDGHREHPAGQRLRRLVHPRAGHHPHRGAPRRRTRDRRADQRRLRPRPARHRDAESHDRLTRRTRPVEPLRIGVLGAARISELSIVGPAAATGTRLVAVAARDRDRAETLRPDPRHRAGPRVLRRRDRRPRGRGDLQPARQQPARALEQGRDPRREARPDREAVRQQRHRGRPGAGPGAGQVAGAVRGLPLPVPPADADV